MKQILLPGTDLVVSRLSFGTASLHHLFDSRSRQRLLAAAIDTGFSHFDTAPSYGFGIAERELGTIAAALHEQVTIATKIGLYPPGGREAKGTLGVWLRKGVGRVVPSYSRTVVDWSLGRATSSLERSLRRLARPRVDILFLHEPDPALIAADEFFHWFEQQRSLGKLRYWGLAGNAETFSAWISETDGLGQVLQVRDRLDQGSSHPVLDRGRNFQFTFGYMSTLLRSGKTVNAGEVMRAALHRNWSGSVLCSTRKATNLTALAHAVVARDG